MSKKPPSLSDLLDDGDFPSINEEEAEPRIKKLQQLMVRIQQGLYHSKGRAIVAVEGFDAAGKGGAIRYLTEKIDPRGVRVHSIGPPSEIEQGTHWLYRFWRALPRPGRIAIFDRTWYGRVLVERVDRLVEKATWKRAYEEINQFEAMLVNDGIHVIKIFLAISKKEQWKRFEDRLNDPYKQWKITDADIHARKKWSDYVEATDDLFEQTHEKGCRWHLIPANDKPYARLKTLECVTEKLETYGSWMESRAAKARRRSLKEAMKDGED